MSANLDRINARLARIHQWRPWERSTGPRTPAGKARVARNADRGGIRHRERALARQLRALMGALRPAA